MTKKDLLKKSALDKLSEQVIKCEGNYDLFCDFLRKNARIFLSQDEYQEVSRNIEDILKSKDRFIMFCNNRSIEIEAK